MGFWDIFRRRSEEPEPEVTPPVVSDVLLRALLGGETITRDKALTLPAVSGAVDFIGSAIASMPVRLYKERDGKVEELKKDSRVKHLNGDTGDTLDGYQMKKAMVTDYLLGKGGYCYIRKYRNEVTGLFYVEDKEINILTNNDPIFKDYQILVQAKTFKPFEFVKLLRNTKDGASGKGLTEEISKELETAYNTLLFQLGMVKSGGNKKGFLKSQRKLAQEEINVLKQAWANLYGNNSENVVVLNNGLEFQEASSSSVEMQMNESKRTMTDEINSLFHIYPNDFDRTYKEAIYPIVKAFETTLNRDLLLEREKKNHYFEFDPKEILRVNLRERYESYRIAKETGFLTLNEIREAENLDWIEGLDVINVGLGAVLYDINKQVYYTPNTDTIGDIDETEVPQEEMIEEAEKPTEELTEDDGNAADIEQRFNPNHDAKTGRFTTKNGGDGVDSSNDSSDGDSGITVSGARFVKADRTTQAKHKQAIEKLNGAEYNNGTYDMNTLKEVDYSGGYQVTFSQIGDNYTPDEYADKVNEFLNVSSDGIASAGKFDGYPEISFNVEDKDTAIRLAEKYNQISIWDWGTAKGKGPEYGEIKTGGTGRKE